MATFNDYYYTGTVTTNVTANSTTADVFSSYYPTIQWHYFIPKEKKEIKIEEDDLLGLFKEGD